MENPKYDKLIAATQWFDYRSYYDNLAVLLTSQPKMKFVEVGTWRGDSLIYLVKQCLKRGVNMPQFYGVDAFDKTPSVAVLEQLVEGELPELWNIYNYNLTKNGVRQHISDIKELSVDAAAQFENNSLDAVFIDADHTYEGALADIKIWLTKVKPNAILSGHDYSKSWPGVKRAVDEVLGANKITQHPGSVWCYKKGTGA